MRTDDRTAAVILRQRQKLREKIAGENVRIAALSVVHSARDLIRLRLPCRDHALHAGFIQQRLVSDHI